MKIVLFGATLVVSASITIFSAAFAITSGQDFDLESFSSTEEPARNHDVTIGKFFPLGERDYHPEEQYCDTPVPYPAVTLNSSGHYLEDGSCDFIGYIKATEHLHQAFKVPDDRELFKVFSICSGATSGDGMQHIKESYISVVKGLGSTAQVYDAYIGFDENTGDPTYDSEFYDYERCNLLPIPGLNVTEFEKPYIAKKGANFRAGPGKGFMVKGQLKSGEKFQATGIADGWIRLERGGSHVFVWKNLVQPR